MLPELLEAFHDHDPTIVFLGWKASDSDKLITGPDDIPKTLAGLRVFIARCSPIAGRALYTYVRIAGTCNLQEISSLPGLSEVEYVFRTFDQDIKNRDGKAFTARMKLFPCPAQCENYQDIAFFAFSNPTDDPDRIKAACQPYIALVAAKDGITPIPK
jgi:hypothetical protein